MSMELINSADDVDHVKEVDALSDNKLHLSSTNESQRIANNTSMSNNDDNNDKEDIEKVKKEDLSREDVNDNDIDRVVPFYPTASVNPLKSRPNNELTQERNVNETAKRTSVAKDDQNGTSLSLSSSPRKSVKTREENQLKPEESESESYQPEEEKEEMEYSEQDSHEESNSDDGSELSAHFDPTVMREGILRHRDQKAHSRRRKSNNNNNNSSHHRHHWSHERLPEVNQLPQAYLTCGPSCNSNDNNYNTEQLITTTNINNSNNYNPHGLPLFVPSSAPLNTNTNNAIATQFNVESDRDDSNVEYIAFSLPSNAVQLTTIPLHTTSPQRINVQSYNTPVTMIPLTSLPAPQPFPSWSSTWSSETERETNTIPMIFSYQNEVPPTNAPRPFYPHIIPFQTTSPVNPNPNNGAVNTTCNVTETIRENNESGTSGVNRRVMTTDQQHEEEEEIQSTNIREVQRTFPFTANTNINTTLPYFQEAQVVQHHQQQEQEEEEEEEEEEHEEEEDNVFSDDSSGIGECTLFANFCRSCEEDIKAASSGALNEINDAKIARMLQLESRMTDSRSLMNETINGNEECHQHLLSCRHSLPTPPVVPSATVRSPRMTQFQRHTISYDNHQQPENVLNSHLCNNDEADATLVDVTPTMAWTEGDHVPEWVSSMATAANSHANVNTDNINNIISNGRSNESANNTQEQQPIPPETHEHSESLLENEALQNQINKPL